MKKKENWQSAFNKHLLGTMERKFRIGRHDCCMAASRILQILTGENVRKLFEAYGTKEEAEEVKKKFGGICGIAQHVADVYNLEEVSISRASGGDVVVVESGKDDLSLGVVALGGRYVYVPRSPEGWAMTPVKQAVVVYRVP